MTQASLADTAADRPATRLATRIAFFVAGFGIACWAPLVPYAKQRLGVGDAALGVLLLALGVGSLAAMMLAGAVSARRGCRPVIVAGGLGLAAVLPFLALVGTPAGLGAALFLFGAALGGLDVAMNIHAVEVERAAPTPLMSGFHAFFSIGGFSGALMVTAMLSLGLTPLAATCVAAAAMLAGTLVAAPRLLVARGPAGGPLFALPRGIVLLLAALSAVMFLVEGALLDWGALLLTVRGLTAEAQAGLGYTVFSIAMTIGRLTGDAVTVRFGDRAVLTWGGVAAVVGLAALQVAPHPAAALASFGLIGLGAADLVPILFRRAGDQTVMPPGLAVTAIASLGYAGILLGPAAIGFVAGASSLPVAFWLLAGLTTLVPLCARAVTGSGRG